MDNNEVQQSFWKSTEKSIETNVQKFKQTVISKIGNHLDIGYRYAQSKNPKTQDDIQFISKFQNILFLQLISISLLLVTMGSSMRLVQIAKLKKTVPNRLIVGSVGCGILGLSASIKSIQEDNKYQVIKRGQKYEEEFKMIVQAITPLNKVQSSQ